MTQLQVQKEPHQFNVIQIFANRIKLSWLTQLQNTYKIIGELGTIEGNWGLAVFSISKEWEM